MTRRVQAFVVVGLLGFVLQLGVLHWLADVWHWPYALATLAAVEAAVVHNFVWHERWTWADRHEEGGLLLQRWMRFHLGTGLTSLIGNVVVTTFAVEVLNFPILLANASAVAAVSVANFLVSDRWVFGGSVAAFGVAVILATPGNALAASPGASTLNAWNRHIIELEASLRNHEFDAPPAGTEGRSIGIDGGAIHEWRGSTVVRGMTVTRLVTALAERGVPPPADDLLDARVLGRSGDSLRVYLRISRSAVMTVTYDTEHDVTFVRRSPTLAMSRSRSTAIRELGSADHGFLWRLNSYWRYRQQGDDVVVDVLSVSLSRDMPVVVRPIALPVIDHVARESMQRTLDAVSRFGTSLRKNEAG